jgi:hypothetical protein
MSGSRASDADRAYFRRLAEASGPLDDEAPPNSLDELFERLARMRSQLGPLGIPGAPGEDESELMSHLRIYQRWSELRGRRSQRS